MTSDLLTIDEAAEVLTVSRRMVYREHERGRITFVKLGSRTRIKRFEPERSPAGERADERGVGWTDGTTRETPRSTG